MRISFDVTPRGVVSVIWWNAVALVLGLMLIVATMLLTSTDRSGAGMFILVITMIAGQHFYLMVIPVLVMDFGMAYDAKKSSVGLFSIGKWFCGGLALYIVAFSFLFLILV